MCGDKSEGNRPVFQKFKCASTSSLRIYLTCSCEERRIPTLTTETLLSAPVLNSWNIPVTQTEGPDIRSQGVAGRPRSTLEKRSVCAQHVRGSGSAFWVHWGLGKSNVRMTGG